MPVRMHHIDREFSPAEAAVISGVSVDLQRDWRRRGILPENKNGKWTRFSLDHVIRMAVMKDFSDAGYSVSYIAEFAGMAILPVSSLLHEKPGAVAFEGDEISDKLKALATSGSVVGAHGRYLVMIKSASGGQPSIARFNDLEALDTYLTENNASHCTILSFEHLADAIASKAGVPLMRIEVERVDGDDE